MPAVATTRPSSHRPSERSSSATGDGVSRYGPVGVSPNAPAIACRKSGHSSGVAGRSWSVRSSATGVVYRAGPTVRQRVPLSRAGRPASPSRAGADLVLRETELGEDVLGVFLDRTGGDDEEPCDGAVRVALGDQAQHLPLAGRQPPDG